MIQALYNNEWVNWKPAGFQVFDFSTLTKEDFTKNAGYFEPSGSGFKLCSNGSQSWDIHSVEKITVLEGKKLYYSANNSELYYNGELMLKREDGSIAVEISFSNGQGKSGSVDVPVGEYYIHFGGWSHLSSTTGIWNYCYIK